MFYVVLSIAFWLSLYVVIGPVAVLLAACCFLCVLLFGAP